MNNTIEFVKFPKMARYSREVIVTEKIDGTNAQIFISDEGDFLSGSRKRWINRNDDNAGFSRWAQEHKEELLQLGPGRHFGEWWGTGIQRRYGLTEKRFSLFNVLRWESADRPDCCHVVPTLWRGTFNELNTDDIMKNLKVSGSIAAPNFMRPEGIVIFHMQGNFGLKMTFEHDDTGKWCA